MSVLPFKRKPERHLVGDAFCLECKHEWIAEIPIPEDGWPWLECPACGVEKGRWKGPYLPSENDAVFTCNCGNNLLQALESGYHHCPNCGTYHKI